MATQYEDPCVLWIMGTDGRTWVRYLDCRSREVAEKRAGQLAMASRQYRLGETMKILPPEENP